MPFSSARSTYGNSLTLFAGVVAFSLSSLLQVVPTVADQVWHHGTALVGEPRYAEGFPHFDYVNPKAPKGGTLRLSETGSFDTFNPLPAKGELATGLGLIYETLMTSSEDEISAEYGLIAEALSHPDDYSSVTYRLNPNAKWHDGTPISVDDVIWSFEQTISLNPQREFYYQHVERAEATGSHEVTFHFDEKNNRELPHIVGQLLILPKHWWEGTDANGRQRNPGETTLEPPLGSGPYRIADTSPGSTVRFERVEDYWGETLNVNVGQNNFDAITYTYFGDRNVEFEAFKADEFDYWSENEAKRWATGYDFPAANEGLIKRELLENLYRSRGLLVGFIPNLRRDKFQDPKIREALSYAFDFEELNRTIFFQQYERISSFFFGTDLASQGLPEGQELEILQSLENPVPERVFTTPFENPVGGNPAKLRGNLRKAVQLFGEAGYQIKDNVMVDGDTGEPYSFEILLNGPIIERVALPFAENLKRIGVEVTVRTVEPAQYVNRQRARDFDVIYTGWAQSLSPGNEQFEYWGSESASRDGSANYAGISDPAVDELVKRISFAKDREELIAATKALDRVLLHNHFTIPTYTLRSSRLAYWDRFDRPENLPTYSTGFPTIWWSKSANN